MKNENSINFPDFSYIQTTIKDNHHNLTFGRHLESQNLNHLVSIYIKDKSQLFLLIKNVIKLENKIKEDNVSFIKLFEDQNKEKYKILSKIKESEFSHSNFEFASGISYLNNEEYLISEILVEYSDVSLKSILQKNKEYSNKIFYMKEVIQIIYRMKKQKITTFIPKLEYFFVTIDKHLRYFNFGDFCQYSANKIMANGTTKNVFEFYNYFAGVMMFFILEVEVGNINENDLFELLNYRNQLIDKFNVVNEDKKNEKISRQIFLLMSKSLIDDQEERIPLKTLLNLIKRIEEISEEDLTNIVENDIQLKKIKRNRINVLANPEVFYKEMHQKYNISELLIRNLICSDELIFDITDFDQNLFLVINRLIYINKKLRSICFICPPFGYNNNLENPLNFPGFGEFIKLLSLCENIKKVELNNLKSFFKQKAVFHDFLFSFSKISISNLTITKNEFYFKEDLNSFFDNLHEFSKLEYLNLAQNNIGIKGAEKLSAKIGELTNLIGIDLRSNRIQDLGIQFLSEPLSKLFKITHLILGWNQITSIGVKHLSTIIQNKPKMIELSIGGVEMSQDTIEEFASNLGATKTLKSITMDSCKLNEKCLIQGCSGFSQLSHMEELFLGNNFFEYEGTVELTKLINTYPLLNVLCIENNNIGDKGIVQLSKYLKTNNMIKKLNLSQNNITSEGFKNFFEALQNLTNLEYFNFGKNNIGSENALNLTQIVWKFEKIKFLGLADCSIGVDIVSQIIEYFEKHISLSIIDLSENKYNFKSLKKSNKLKIIL